MKKYTSPLTGKVTKLEEQLEAIKRDYGSDSDIRYNRGYNLEDPPLFAAELSNQTLYPLNPHLYELPEEKEREEEALKE